MAADASGESSPKSGLGTLLNKIEKIYLRILRIAILLIATLLIGYACYLGIASVIKIARSPESVKEREATVSADELVNADIPQKNDLAIPADQKIKIDPVQRQYYRSFVGRYYHLYKTNFEPFRQPEDKQLSQDEFDDSFVNTEARLNAVAAGNVDFTKDKADLESLLGVMTQAAGDPETKRRLKQYKEAKKVQVTKNIQRMRTEYRRGWDSYSTACDNWYDTPIGCAVRRPVQVPYTDTVTVMEFPASIRSHTQVFKAYQDRYYTLIGKRRERAAADAAAERDRIVAGNAEGRVSLVTAMWILGAFLALMFFFLLIAIERHQRQIAGEWNRSDI